MKITTVSQKGIDLIKKYEGFQSKPYLCPAKVPTIGYGATYYPDGRKVKITDSSITEQDAERMLKTHLKTYEASVNRYTTDKVTQNQFDALVSFCYNLGAQALKNSTLLKKVNTNPDDVSIELEFLKWVNAGGRKLEGLVRRRKEEAKLYFSQ